MTVLKLIQYLMLFNTTHHSHRNCVSETIYMDDSELTDDAECFVNAIQ